MTTSSSSTSRSASRPIRAWAGPGRTSSVAWPLRATGSRPPGRPSDRASSADSTSARRGLMVVAKSEYAYSRLKQAFRSRTVDKTYHALVQGLPDPRRRHHRRTDRPPPRPRLQVRGHEAAASRRSPTTRSSRPSGTRACSTSTSRRAARTRSGCTSRRCTTPAAATRLYGADPHWRAKLEPGSAVAARRWTRVRAPRHGRLRPLRERLPGGSPAGS